MAPRSKRARTSSTVNEDDGVASQEDLTSRLGVRPHETLWQEDGNIVLATDAFLYRVHKSVLAKNSTVFKDMLQLPNTGDVDGRANDGAGLVSSADDWNGVPLVKMAGDRDVDVYNFLMTLYDRSHYRMYETTTSEILTSLIVMSVKYDCQEIRTEVERHLVQHFTSKLPDFDREKEKKLFNDPPAGYEFKLLFAAGLLSVPVVLPSLFYLCAIHPLPFIFQMSDEVPKNILERIILGRERMLKWANEVGNVALRPETRCSSHMCIRKREALHLRHVGLHTFDTSVSPLQVSPQGIFAVDAGVYPEICQSCISSNKNAVSRNRTFFWMNLPRIFGFEPWTVLQERSAVPAA